MAGVTAAVVGSAVVGGIAANSAARRQERAANNATSAQQQQYYQQREDAAPWRDAGVKALSGLQKDEFSKDFTMQDFQQDPGYMFRMQEGQKAINNSAAARGMGNSGATMKALARYGQDFATGEYTNAYNRFNADKDRRFNRLSSLAGVGQTANSQVAQAGSNMANNVGNNMMSAGAARAAGTMGMANAFSGAVGQGLNYYQNQQMMNQMSAPAGGGMMAMNGNGTNFSNLV